MDATIDLLTFALLPDLGPRTARQVAERTPIAEALAHPEDHADRLSAAAIAALRAGTARRAAEAESARATQLGARIVGWDEPDYPPSLRAIWDPPPVLFVRGRVAGAETAVAIVGSRAASPRGTALARAMARELAGAGVTIVSGLARGIDTAAHEGALEAGGRTVAVLGSGLEKMYPRQNAALGARIAERGAVVTEFPLCADPHPGSFPRRNRIIAGWSVAVVVVEAAHKSGALVTARSAADEGRDVLAVPGHPGDENAAGTNQLIRDGAGLVRGAADVAAEIGIELKVAAVERGVDDRVLGALRRDLPSSLDQILERSGSGVAETLTRLAELELDAKVKRLPGALFVRN